ncbi:MAG: glycosyltransferase family 39 protein [Gemmatimonadaceae bacterium]|nr:glycosyltransferase family 39 protein [Gemmatimonadaceae bacterium]
MIRLPQTPFAPTPRGAAAITPLEVLLLALATLAGLALRGWHLDLAGLTHFDEGVYAFSGLGVADASQPARLFPEQQKFSPPVYFTLVALFNLLGATPERSPFVVNLVMGTVSIPVLWVLTRRWFGPVAAMAAAWWLAGSEFHVAMSRTALTDVTFALTFVIALGAVIAAIDRGSRASAVLAGVCVGLAWNTKYHGWFALVVGAMVIAARWQMQGAGLSWLRERIRIWLVMSVVAFVCYLPWTLFIQTQPGSSSGWVSYFATMLRLDWFGNLWRQVEQQAYLEGAWSRASVPLGAVAAWLVARRTGRDLAWWFVPALAIAAMIVGSAGTALLLAIVGLGMAWRRGMTLPAWLLASVLALWFVMAPVYHPYFRLILPFTIATFALGGAAVEDHAVPVRAASPWRGLLVGAVAVLAAGAVGVWRADPSDPWRSTTGLVAAADRLSADVPAGEPVSVIGEPALAFYLQRRGHPSWQRTTIEGLDSLTAPRYVVTGIYARRAPMLVTRLQERRDHLELLDRVPISPPSDLRLLDDFKPDSARRWLAVPDSTYDLLLYRYTPPAVRR